MDTNSSPILLRDLGMKFPTEKSKFKRRYGLYKCGYCGKEFEAQTANINFGQTKSCGCLVGIFHGLTNHRLYGIWESMTQRCYNITNISYKNYGARGITVCDEWRDTPTQFIKDMYPSFQEGLSLDRIDNDTGYSKDNCRWETRENQNVNQRIQKNNSTGFIGISFHSRDLKFMAYINFKCNRISLGYYKTAVEAAIARNKYIIENGLPHKLNIIPEEIL